MNFTKKRVCLVKNITYQTLYHFFLYNLDLLMMKSLLDGITAIVFASVMGIGVAFSALAVLVYQGFLTLFSRPFHTFLSNTSDTSICDAP